MTKKLTTALVLAGFLGIGASLPVVAAEDNTAAIAKLEAESARYSGLAKEQEKLRRHYTLASTGNVKGGQNARAAYHDRLASEYRAKAEVYANEAQELRDAGKRVASN